MNRAFSDQDHRYMREALRLARRGRGRVEPNPMVGCVLVRAGRVIGSGWHRRYGGAHAEADALKRAFAPIRGATAYVTLEPCSHFGKTPPCAEALIESGVSRVVTAMLDPFPQVAGRGASKLQKAGIRVDVGLMAGEAAELNAPYLTRIVLDRPYVIAKWAQSLDGRVATRRGDSQWISGEASRRLVHRWRSQMDAVMVGIGTILADDPMLTAREVPIRRVASRVVLDSHLRIPPKSRILASTSEAPVIVATTREAVRRHGSRARRIERLGASVLACRSHREGVSIKDLLGRLAKRGMTNVLIEGGPTLTGSLMDQRLIDEIRVFLAPIIIGGKDAPAALGGTGVASLVHSINCNSMRCRRLGTDLLMLSRVSDARRFLVNVSNPAC